MADHSIDAHCRLEIEVEACPLLPVVPEYLANNGYGVPDELEPTGG